MYDYSGRTVVGGTRKRKREGEIKKNSKAEFINCEKTILQGQIDMKTV